jgi:hypothetical protein
VFSVLSASGAATGSGKRNDAANFGEVACFGDRQDDWSAKRWSNALAVLQRLEAKEKRNINPPTILTRQRIS